MITLLSILRELGPGYWAEFRFINRSIEVNLHFRNVPNDLVMRKAQLYTEDLILDNPKFVENSMREMAKELQTAVTIKLHTDE